MSQSEQELEWEVEAERVAQDNEKKMRVGDILIFKLPLVKPSMGDRFISFMQGRRDDCRTHANAVHAAVVTTVAFGGVELTHFVGTGCKREFLNNTVYANHPYERFRATDTDVARAIFLEANRVAALEDNQQDKPHYSFKKIIAAFLRTDKISLPDKVKKAKVFEELTSKGNTEEFCSSFVWRCIKAGVKNTADAMRLQGASSFILPGALALNLHSLSESPSKKNLFRSIPTPDNQQQVVDAVLQSIAKELETGEKKSLFLIWAKKTNNSSDQLTQLRKLICMDSDLIGAEEKLKQALKILHSDSDSKPSSLVHYKLILKTAETLGMKGVSAERPPQRPLYGL